MQSWNTINESIWGWFRFIQLFFNSFYDTVDNTCFMCYIEEQQSATHSWTLITLFFDLQEVLINLELCLLRFFIANTIANFLYWIFIAWTFAELAEFIIVINNYRLWIFLFFIVNLEINFNAFIFKIHSERPEHFRKIFPLQKLFIYLEILEYFGLLALPTIGLFIFLKGQY